MTEKRTFEMLKAILDEINEETYPEIFDIVDANIIEEEEDVFEDAFILAKQMHDADGNKELPKSVTDFLLAVYEDEIKEGNADAACNIGSLYYTGRCGVQDYAKAVHYYTIAAEGGCRQAQENLGYCYYYGRDVEKDYAKAFHFFALGAFDGHLRSLYKIGDMYRNGYYVKKNEKEAFLIYQHCVDTLTDLAAKQVGADIMMRMGDCYFDGIGVEKDHRSAFKFYQIAENMFMTRLDDGDFLIKGCYQKVVKRIDEIRREFQGNIWDGPECNRSK